MSRVLLAGVAVAGAVATTSAFTASNTFAPGASGNDNVAGFAEASVSGATITNIAYTPHSDASQLASVVFQASNDFVGSTSAVMVLKLGAATATGQANSCLVDAVAEQITCTLTAPMPFVNFNVVALTVASQ
jgi:hypothetical protein